MALDVDQSLKNSKSQLLRYFRNRARESLADIYSHFGKLQYKKRAAAINRTLAAERENLTALVRQAAQRESWNNDEILRTILLLTHCANVVMLEARNTEWPYEYMAFSRRIGEIWEPYCTICFQYPVRTDVSLFLPPVFVDVRERLVNEIRDFIVGLGLRESDKATLLNYYDKVWSLVSSGEIKLELDLHFRIDSNRFVVDLKSGFGSNEKGNTNRLLLVASVYRNIEPDDYTCMLLVRSAEDQTNHYLQTLKQSGLWEVYCGSDAYHQVEKYSGFDLGNWIAENVDWPADLDSETMVHLQDNDLAKYLTW